MNRPVSVVFAAVLAIGLSNQARAQVVSRLTPGPVVSAQHEAWYLNGEPVTFAGNVYYPTGPRIHFNRYEMVLSGTFRGVPLYTRTTIEPFSLVYLPIDGGLMQPYERRRTGDIAGTVGSTTPSFPVDVASEWEGTIQAQGPPTGVDYSPVSPVGPEVPAVRRARRHSTRGVVPSGIVPPAPPVWPMRSAARPEGLNAAFVDFRGQRYVNRGVPVLLGRDSFDRVGTHYGLPVYARRGDPRTIYVPVQRDAELLAPYTRRGR